MTGHDALIAVRRQGLKPAGVVYVDDFEVLPKFRRWIENDTEPVICTHGDNPAALDLRCLVGLFVVVNGDVATRVKKLAKAVLRAGASDVVALCGDKGVVWSKEEKKWLPI